MGRSKKKFIDKKNASQYVMMHNENGRVGMVPKYGYPEDDAFAGGDGTGDGDGERPRDGDGSAAGGAGAGADAGGWQYDRNEFEMSTYEFPDDGYDYLKHLRPMNAGGGQYIARIEEDERGLRIKPSKLKKDAKRDYLVQLRADDGSLEPVLVGDAGDATAGGDDTTSTSTSTTTSASASASTASAGGGAGAKTTKAHSTAATEAAGGFNDDRGRVGGVSSDLPAEVETELFENENRVKAHALSGDVVVDDDDGGSADADDDFELEDDFMYLADGGDIEHAGGGGGGHALYDDSDNSDDDDGPPGLEGQGADGTWHDVAGKARRGGAASQPQREEGRFVDEQFLETMKGYRAQDIGELDEDAAMEGEDGAPVDLQDIAAFDDVLDEFLLEQEGENMNLPGVDNSNAAAAAEEAAAAEAAAAEAAAETAGDATETTSTATTAAAGGDDDDDEAPMLVLVGGKGRQTESEAFGDALENMELYDRRKAQKSRDAVLSQKPGADIVASVKKYIATEAERGTLDEVATQVIAVRQEEQWDCESILTTYTNLDNHPKLLVEKKDKRIRVGRMGVIRDKPSVADVDEADEAESAAAEAAEEDSANGGDAGAGFVDLTPVNKGEKRSKLETKEEKRRRKAAVKAARASKRQAKKALKATYKQEEKRQVRVNIQQASNKVSVVHF